MAALLELGRRPRALRAGRRRCTASRSTVEEGQIVAVLGANGAGKTTTLRAISNTRAARRSDPLRRPAARTRRPRRRCAARHRSRPRGARHVRRAHRLGEPAPRRVQPARVRQGGLRPRHRLLPVDRTSGRNQQAGTLSGGEQQMLALARAFMQRPRLLLLDEPSLGLAPLLVTEIFRIIKDLNETRASPCSSSSRTRTSRCSSRRPRTCSRSAAIALSGPSAELQQHESDPPELPGLLMTELAAQTPLHLAASDRRRRTGASMPVILLIGRRDLPRRSARSSSSIFAQQTVAGLVAGRDLREPRARARAHLPRDRGDQLRPGRDGDGDDVRRVPAHRSGVSRTGSRSSLTLAIAFVFGVAIQLVVIRPVQHRSVIAVVIVTVGLFILIDGLVTWKWGADLQVHDGAVRQRRSTTSAASRSRARISASLLVSIVSVILLWRALPVHEARPRRCAPRRSARPPRRSSACA